MSTIEFGEATLKEVFLKIEANRLNDAAEWLRTRQIAYTIFCSIPRKEGSQIESIYKFMPLPDDPTEEELKKMEEESRQAQIKEFEKEIKYYQKMGWLSPVPEKQLKKGDAELLVQYGRAKKQKII